MALALYFHVASIVVKRGGCARRDAVDDRSCRFAAVRVAQISPVATSSLGASKGGDGARDITVPNAIWITFMRTAAGCSGIM